MKYRLIAFDWDGTVMDSTGLIAACIRDAALAVGFAPPSGAAAKSVIGLGLLAAMETLFPRAQSDKRNAFVAKFRDLYVPRDHEAPLYEGIADLIALLQHEERFLVVATGKPRQGLERSFDYCGLRAQFNFSRCGDEGFPKPHPEMLFELMKSTGVTSAETLMIGDTTHDLQMAAAAGVDAVAVTYGAHRRDYLESAAAEAPALAYLDSVAALRAWLEAHG